MTHADFDHHDDIFHDLAPVSSAPIDDLISSTQLSFSILEPWCHARNVSESPLLNDIVLRMQCYSTLYFHSIDISVKTSENGVSLAMDAIHLCDFLCGDAPVDHVIAFIEDLEAISAEAQQDAQAAHDNFSKIRHGIWEVMALIPDATKQIIVQARVSGAAARRHETIADSAAAVNDAVKGDGLMAGLSFMASIPHIAILLPLVIPVVALVAGKAEKIYRHKAEVRQQQRLSCQDTLVQLQKAEIDIQHLLNHIGMFIKWWSDMKTRLFNVKQKISKFGSKKPDTTIVITLKERWSKVENDYRIYMCEISKLQDFYPETHLEHRVEDSLEILLSEVHLEYGAHQKLGSTLASLSKEVKRCDNAFSCLQTATKDVREKYRGGVYRQLDDIKAVLVAEFDCISGLLRRYASQDDDDNFEDNNSTLEALQEALNLHSRSQDMFMSHKAAITKVFSTKILSGKNRDLRNLHAEAREMSGEESDQPQLAFLERNITFSQPNPAKALSAMETGIHGIGSALDELLQFWKIITVPSRLSGRRRKLVLGNETLVKAKADELSFASQHLMTQRTVIIPKHERIHLRDLMGIPR